MATVLQDGDGEDAVFQEGESGNLVVVFKDMDGNAIAKAALISLVCTQYDRDTRTVINGRENQNVLDANNGAVASNGTLTLRLGPDDTVLIGNLAYGSSETHCLLFRWTWSDSVETRTGKCGPLTFRIENLVEPT
jgi:hypothetical protein